MPGIYEVLTFTCQSKLKSGHQLWIKDMFFALITFFAMLKWFIAIICFAVSEIIIWDEMIR